jgi:hypothetical protein
MKIVGYMVNSRHLKYISDSDWVFMDKITPENVAKVNLVCVHKYKNKDVPKAICWKNKDDTWNVYFVIDPDDYTKVIKLDDQIPTDCLHKVTTEILNNSVCRLWVKTGLNSRVIVDEIVRKILNKRRLK